MGYGTLVSLVFHNLPSLYPSSFCRNDFYTCIGWAPLIVSLILTEAYCLVTNAMNEWLEIPFSISYIGHKKWHHYIYRAKLHLTTLWKCAKSSNIYIYIYIHTHNSLCLGFIDYIVSPLFDVCGDMLELLSTSVLPGNASYSRPWLVNLAHNRERWLRDSHTPDDTPSTYISIATSPELVVLFDVDTMAILLLFSTTNQKFYGPTASCRRGL